MKKNEKIDFNDLSEAEQLKTITQAIKSINIKLATKKMPIFDLEAALNDYSLRALKKMASHHGVKLYTKLAKPELVKVICQKLTDPDHLKEIFKYFDSRQWYVIKDAYKLNYFNPQEYGVFDPEDDIFVLGLLRAYYYDDLLYFIMPNEVKLVVKSIMTIKYVTDWERSCELNELAMACANLYGVITIKEFVDLFNSIYQKPTNVSEVNQVLCRHEFWRNGYEIFDDYIANDIFRNSRKLFTQTLDAIVGKKRYIPQFEELFLYVDRHYFEETDQFNNFVEYLHFNLKIDEFDAEECAEEIMLIKKIGFDSADTLTHILNKHKVFPPATIEDAQSILTLAMDLQNHTRIWANKGFTPAQLSRFKPIRKSVKVGRNEPCPCESGKKYKYCCLLKVS